MKLSIISPYPPIKGGISKETELLYYILKDTYKINIFGFEKLYPSFLYPSKNQSDISVTKNNNTDIDYCINTTNPYTWFKTANKIININTTHLLIRFWNPFFIPMYIFLINKIKKNNSNIKISCICDNIYPHERIFFDEKAIKYFFNKVDSFMVMSNDSEKKLRNLIGSNSIIIKSFLPLKFTYKNKLPQSVALEKLDIKKPKLLLLFFGFVREYKGLDLLLKAIANIPKLDIKLIIAGNCNDNENKYKKLIKDNNLEDSIFWHNKYIPDSDVENYFSACDAVILPHIKISQSGIIPLAYEFNKLIIASDIPSFKENIEDGQTGYLFKNNNYISLKEKIEYIYNYPNSYKSNIEDYKQKYSKDNLISDFDKLLNI